MKKTFLFAFTLILSFSQNALTATPECQQTFENYQDLQDKHQEMTALLVATVKSASDDFFAGYSECTHQHSNCTYNLYVHHSDYGSIYGKNNFELKYLNADIKKATRSLTACIK